jgi:hypothetical protein
VRDLARQPHREHRALARFACHRHIPAHHARELAREALDVNFQEVVHSVPAGNADVARQKRFAEVRMDTHKNARLNDE